MLLDVWLALWNREATLLLRCCVFIFNFIFHIIAVTKKEKNLSVNLCFQFVKASEGKEKKVAEKEVLKGLKGI